MTASSPADSLRAFLADRGGGLLISEVVAGLRPAGLDEAVVLATLKQLAETGAVVWRSFPVRDPHLAFTALDFVAAVAPGGDGRQAAERAVEKAFENWLRSWLSGHRCG